MSSQRRFENGLCDPSLKDGGEIVFDEEIPLEIRSGDGTDESELIVIRFKIIVHEDDGVLQQVRLEITSDSDLFFLYESTFTTQDYAELQARQKLKIDFGEFPHVLRDILAQNSGGKGEFSVVFVQDARSHGILSFQQNLKLKSVEIFALEFVPASDELVRDQIQYRYNLARSKLKIAKADLDDLYAMLKIKNPSVLKQVRSSRK
jgi:hypothetical protein